jgi:hypothetical protein
MSNEKKYIIVWSCKNGIDRTFYTGYGCFDNIICSWSPDFIKASTFTLSNAREILSKIKEFYSTQDCRANIHEYIPAHCGEALKSDKDRVIEKLQHAVNCNYNIIEDMERVDNVFGDVYNVAHYLAEAIRILKNMK